MQSDSTIFPAEFDQSILLWMQQLSLHGICVTDADLRIQGWNLWLEANSGLSRKEVIGRPLLEVFPEVESRRLHGYFSKALRGEVSVLASVFHGYLFPLPSPIKDPRFSKMLQTARISPLLRDGKVVGTITTVEDVTQREYQAVLLRKQHERQELFSWVLAHLLQAKDAQTMVKEIFPRISAHIDVDVFFNYLNDGEGGCLRLHSCGGVPMEEREKFAAPGVGDGVCGAAASERRSIVLSDIHENSQPQGALVRELGLRVYVSHPLLVDTKVIGTLSFGSRARARFQPEEIEFTRIVAQYVAVAIERSRTVEALHKTQAELGVHTTSLEEKVRERTAKLQESIGELESFSYSLAHDVRAPLRHIKSYAQALVEDCAKEFSPPAQKYVDSILRSIHKLDALTHDILAYSQVSQGAVQLVPVDLEALLRDIISRSPDLERAGVVTLQMPMPRVLAAKTLLDQSLSNLIDNAIKFVPPGTAPRIVVRAEMREESHFSMPKTTLDTNAAGKSRWVRIWVEDNGIGISPEFHGKIFGIFERLATHGTGTGIGLAIVSKAVERMGGRLGVQSESGGGSKFWLQLPAA